MTPTATRLAAINPHHDLVSTWGWTRNHGPVLESVQVAHPAGTRHVPTPGKPTVCACQSARVLAMIDHALRAIAAAHPPVITGSRTVIVPVAFHPTTGVPLVSECGDPVLAQKEAYARVRKNKTVRFLPDPQATA